MTKKLKIKNVGPITDAIIDLQRFNFFIGPQSSGKSTIAKVFSTCTWIEKEVAMTGNEHLITSPQEFESIMVDFHKLNNYFNDSSEVEFITDVIQLSYTHFSFKINLIKREDFRRKKICYIPSERNAVTLPELQGFEFGQTNLKSFLFDWFNARNNFSTTNKTDILNLGVKYFYDAKETINKDQIEHINGKTYQIPLGSASSGLQSVIPLQIMVDYYCNDYFKSDNKKMSFETNIKLRKVYQELAEGIQDIQKTQEYFERLTVPNKSCFIIEEPEQNLYPNTQTNLLDFLVSKCNDEKKHELTITTHSPYILNQLNLLFRRFDENDTTNVGINFNDVTVYAINNGHLEDLKLRNAHLINPEYLSAPLDYIYDQYESYNAPKNNA